MVLKYKLSFKDIKIEDFKIYLFSLFKAFIPKKKISSLFHNSQLSRYDSLNIIDSKKEYIYEICYKKWEDFV